MKITKFVHSCLMVEMPVPVNRTVLFDPGVFSEEALKVGNLKYLDDIVITHNHSDHLSETLLRQLIEKFPEVRITTTAQAARQLEALAIHAQTETPEGIIIFDAPHEDIFSSKPENIGVHYLDRFTHPGDSHSFAESKEVLALPVSAPWGSAVAAYNLALKLKPKYVLPIHDWHWHDAAKEQIYGKIAAGLNENGINFIGLKSGEPVVLEM